MTPEPEEPRTPELEALLEAARRGGGTPAPAAQEHALAAFRAARDEGRHTARVPWWRRRRRDDWRPASARRGGSALVKGLLAGIAVGAVGGVAVAAGSGVIPTPFGTGNEPGAPRSSSVAPGGTRQGDPAPLEREPGGLAGSTAPPTGGVGPSLPGVAVGDAAQCRVYLAALDRKGVPLTGQSMERLEAAAGGPEDVRAHCEHLLDEKGPQGPDPKDTSRPGQPAEESVKEQAEESDKEPDEEPGRAYPEQPAPSQGPKGDR
ncbi:hypothetical protein [Streptomyces formicae]|uniref:Uncharacterized protein n=1 Tax=Streptomyces formicae TaxID=1616117 RepID=A0ABY3WM28_9ACTN|nr:hypothetical protein [Streptomyces formicae]UNM10898.1 hypothetical protein J4032_04615 [Streptomyces formicae]